MSQKTPIPSAEIDGHLRVDDLSHDLKRRSTRSGAIMIASYGMQMLIGISGTAVLARKLRPGDFGYLAMVMTLINFVLTFRDYLVNPAVQKQHLTHEQASGLFWINCLIGLLMALVVAAMAPVLAIFFHEPRVTNITLAMSGGVFVCMLGMLHAALLRRQMQFGSITMIELSAVIVGTIVAVSAALLGAGYWALIYQQLAVWVWHSAAVWCACPWRPAKPRASAFRSDAGMRSMLRYGKDSTAARVIGYVSRNTDAVLIGHYADAPILGLYQKAYQWAMTPFWQIFLPMSPVAVASFSRLQEDPGRYRLYVRTTLLGMFGLTLPATALMLIEADSVIKFLMGPQWVDAIPMLRMLSVGTYFSSFALVMSWLYLAEGRTTEQVRWSLISAPVTIIAVWIGMYWGAIGVASGFSIASILLAAPGVWIGLRRSPLSWADFWAATWRAATASIVAALLLWLLRGFMPPIAHAFLQVVLHSAIYGVIYITFWLILPGGRKSWRTFVQQLRGRRRPATAI